MFSAKELRIMEKAAATFQPFYGGYWTDSNNNPCPAKALDHTGFRFEEMCNVVWTFVGKPIPEEPSTDLSHNYCAPFKLTSRLGNPNWRSSSYDPSIRYFQNLLHTNPKEVATIFGRMASQREEFELAAMQPAEAVPSGMVVEG